MVLRGIEIVSAHMNQRFAAERKPGVISRGGAPYSGWWNGGLRSTNYFHNVIGILTEAFGQARADPPRAAARAAPVDRRLSGPGAGPGLARAPDGRVPADGELRDPRLRGALSPRAPARHAHDGDRAIARGRSDHWTVTPALVEAARRRDDPTSVFRDPLLRDPRAYVLRSDQPDWAPPNGWRGRCIAAGSRCCARASRS
jgi:hypothetical protein